MAFSVHSDGWENRALSLERDFIDVVGRTALDTRSPDAEMVTSEVSGLYTKVV